MFKTANNDSISRPNSRPKLPFPGNGKGKFKMPQEGKGREIWGMYSRESRETGIPAHPWFYCSLLFLLFLFLFFKYRNFCCSLFVFTFALYLHSYLHFQLTALTLLTGCPSPLSTVTMQAPQPPSLQETLFSCWGKFKRSWGQNERRITMQASQLILLEDSLSEV